MAPLSLVPMRRVGLMLVSMALGACGASSEGATPATDPSEAPASAPAGESPAPSEPAPSQPAPSEPAPSPRAASPVVSGACEAGLRRRGVTDPAPPSCERGLGLHGTSREPYHELTPIDASAAPSWLDEAVAEVACWQGCAGFAGRADLLAWTIVDTPGPNAPPDRSLGYRVAETLWLVARGDGRSTLVLLTARDALTHFDSPALAESEPPGPGVTELEGAIDVASLVATSTRMGFSWTVPSGRRRVAGRVIGESWPGDEPRALPTLE